MNYYSNYKTPTIQKIQTFTKKSLQKTQGWLVITPLTFLSERCYFMISGSERCNSGHSRFIFEE